MQMMKATLHIQRSPKFNAGHNDHTYDTEKNESITHPDRTQENMYFILRDDTHKYQAVQPGRGEFLRHEDEYYRRHFSAAVKAQNERNEKRRHKERNRTVQQVLKDKKTSPVELIFQIGEREAYTDKIKFRNMIIDTLKQFHGENFRVLDVAIHCDETAMHAHVRGVFVIRDKDGYPTPNQTKALKEMGFDLPDKNKPKGQYNNELISFTDKMRETWYNTIEKHNTDIEIDRVVTSPSRRQKDQLTYKVEELQNLTKNLEAENKKQKAEIAENKKVIEKQEKEIEQNKAYLDITNDMVARKGLHKPLLKQLREEAEKVNDFNKVEALDNILALMDLEDRKEDKTAPPKSLYGGFDGFDLDDI